MAEITPNNLQVKSQPQMISPVAPSSPSESTENSKPASSPTITSDSSIFTGANASQSSVSDVAAKVREAMAQQYGLLNTSEDHLIEEAVKQFSSALDRATTREEIDQLSVEIEDFVFEIPGILDGGHENALENAPVSVKILLTKLEQKDSEIRSKAITSPSMLPGDTMIEGMNDLQWALKQAGYPVEVTGAYDERTALALRQQVGGMKEDGSYPGSNMIEAMNDLQGALQALGYPVSITGAWDEQTAGAVRGAFTDEGEKISKVFDSFN